jgi:hypothetical protein
MLIYKVYKDKENRCLLIFEGAKVRRISGIARVLGDETFGWPAADYFLMGKRNSILIFFLNYSCRNFTHLYKKTFGSVL